MTIEFYKNGNPLSLVGIVDSFTSFSFQRSAAKLGSFQLVLCGDDPVAQQVKNADFIQYGPRKAGVINKVVESFNGHERQITLTGKELKSIAQHRIIMPPADKANLIFDKDSYSPIDVCAELVRTQFINVDKPERLVPSIRVEKFERTRIESQSNYTYRFDNLYDEIEAIALAYKLFWYADIENNQIVFHFNQGYDRTTSQTDNEQAIFSYMIDSFSSSEYSRYSRNLGVTNTAMVAGQGEGTERAIVWVNDSNVDLKRFELYVDARDIENPDDLEQRGKERLAAYEEEENFTCQLIQNALAGYENLYDVGDYCSILDDRIQSGETNLVLTQVEEVYESNEYILNATFGLDTQSIATYIKNQLAETQSLLYTEQQLLEQEQEEEPEDPDNPSGGGGGSHYTSNIYEYAQEAGYTESEEQFKTDLASIQGLAAALGALL